MNTSPVSVERIRGIDPLLNVEDLSTQLGISISTIYRMRSSGESLPRATKLGPRLVRWRQADVDEWVEAHLEDA